MCLAVPGQVIKIDEDPLRTATVSFGGITKGVSLALVPEARVGDYVIVHVGFAISKVNEEAARPLGNHRTSSRPKVLHLQGITRNGYGLAPVLDECRCDRGRGHETLALR